MTKTMWSSIALVAALAAGCGKKKEEGGAAAKPSGGAPAAAAVKASPEMQAFLAALKGKSSDVGAALKAHGAPDLDGKDMDMYDLTSPKVISGAKQGDKDCYDFEAKSGMTTRTYGVCWAAGKIAEVTDKGMR